MTYGISDVFNNFVKKTVVIEKYIVDVLKDSSEEDIKVFVDILVGFNLKLLVNIVESMYVSLLV